MIHNVFLFAGASVPNSLKGIINESSSMNGFNHHVAQLPKVVQEILKYVSKISISTQC
jgi:hypothetical protein